MFYLYNIKNKTKQLLALDSTDKSKTMAKYTITYKCGHTAEVQLYGTYAERESKINYYKTIDCPECRANAAAQEAKAKGYVELVGSAKQISWASDIRDNFFAKVEEIAPKVDRNKDIFDKAVEEIKAETSASWWIDNNNRDALNIIMEKIKTLINK